MIRFWGKGVGVSRRDHWVLSMRPHLTSPILYASTAAARLLPESGAT